LDGFKAAFTEVALGRFGSGWAWLVRDGDALRIESTPNQDSPISQGRWPLLGIDVWEHAYYLKFQNRRADYIAEFARVVDWDAVSARFREAQG
jgi:Fe-Mn family superoxide dismutase